MPATSPTAPETERLERALRLGAAPLRIALALVYFHFGVLKFFPDLSGAEMIATQTILALRLGLEATDALFWLALFEVTLGVLFALRVSMRIVFPLFLVHMAGTFAPLVVLPAFGFKIPPFAPTLEGQYILKNLVFVAAGWCLYLADTTTRRAASERRVSDR